MYISSADVILVERNRTHKVLIGLFRYHFESPNNLNILDIGCGDGILTKRKEEVYVPQFQITDYFSLEGVFQRLGMTDAFSEIDADFSGMTAMNDLYISTILHKAFVDAHEIGTEAAAATSVCHSPYGAPTSIIPIFRADHPFIFLIRDDKTGSIFFMGRLMNPIL